jgi:hypothetical protein
VRSNPTSSLGGCLKTAFKFSYVIIGDNIAGLHHACPITREENTDRLVKVTLQLQLQLQLQYVHTYQR